ncbi:MAG TPA: peroxide stress protein YaaA [Hyphomonadaceae bacterium]|nr:peroxide stress protein YaaA [Hyphomonadaceae bacterium]
MLILLSPAKSLNMAPLQRPDIEPTRPRLVEEITELAAIMKGVSVSQFAALMDLSVDLAALTHARAQAFDPNGALEGAKPALFAFNGDVYRAFEADTLTPAQAATAQAKLRLLSGLYGVLRPYDAIQPYRLEMGARLANPRGRDLYAFWGDKIARQLNADAAAAEVDIILNLASEEYAGAVDRRALRPEFVTLTFKEEENGKARVLGLFAKRARGRFARFCIDHRITDPEELKAVSVDGYRYDESASKEREWVFVRPQIRPQKGA